MNKTDSWELLKKDSDNCKACNLCTGQIQSVLGDGAKDARLMLIGEGPGRDEQIDGIPFTGIAGKLLDRAMLASGLTRQYVYLANVVKHRAFEISQFGNEKNRTPTLEEIQACTPLLLRQIALVKPSFILCIGSPSAKAIINPQFSIMRERGILFKETIVGIPAMACIHPAAILRMKEPEYSNRYFELISDIKKAVEATKFYIKNPIRVFDK